MHMRWHMQNLTKVGVLHPVIHNYNCMFIIMSVYLEFSLGYTCASSTFSPSMMILKSLTASKANMPQTFETTSGLSTDDFVALAPEASPLDKNG